MVEIPWAACSRLFRPTSSNKSPLPPEQHSPANKLAEQGADNGLKKDTRSSGVAITVKVHSELWDQARNLVLHADGNERAVYFLGHRADDTVFLSKLIALPPDAYVEQSGGYLQTRREWIGENVFKIALDGDYDVVADMHSHPFGHGGVMFSSTDDVNDHKKLPHIDDVLSKVSSTHGDARTFTGLSLVRDHASFDGRSYDGTNRTFIPIARLLLIGKDELKIALPSSAKNKKKRLRTQPHYQNRCKFSGPSASKEFRKLT